MAAHESGSKFYACRAKKQIVHVRKNMSNQLLFFSTEQSPAPQATPDFLEFGTRQRECRLDFSVSPLLTHEETGEREVITMQKVVGMLSKYLFARCTLLLAAICDTQHSPGVHLRFLKRRDQHTQTRFGAKDYEFQHIFVPKSTDNSPKFIRMVSGTDEFP